MINPKTSRFLAIGLCLPACAALIAYAGGCSEEEPPPVAIAPPPPPPPPPPAPTVTPIEQLMVEMNIDLCRSSMASLAATTARSRPCSSQPISLS
jgi:hypothetical protein